MLHILSRSPINPAILERAITGDIIILIEDAVIEALAVSPQKRSWQQMQQSQKICALAADLEVRGIKSDQILKGIEIIDYQGFVQLTIDNEIIHSWN